MREKYIAPAIMLVAGAITSVLNIVNEVAFLESLKRLLFILIVFYIIGRIATKIISNATNKDIKLTESKESEQIKENQATENLSDIKGE